MCLHTVEKLAGEADHTVHVVGFDEDAVLLGGISFAELVGGHAAVGEDKANDGFTRDELFIDLLAGWNPCVGIGD